MPGCRIARHICESRSSPPATFFRLFLATQKVAPTGAPANPKLALRAQIPPKGGTAVSLRRERGRNKSRMALTAALTGLRD